MKKKFKARVGSPFKQEDAQPIGEELELIKSKDSLTPENVVNKAKDTSSILNKYFEWDNDIASEKYRLQQARNIINHVVEVVVIKGEEVQERAYFNVIAKNDERVYVSVSEAIKTPSYRRQLLGEMESTMENLLRLIKLFSSIE